MAIIKVIIIIKYNNTNRNNNTNNQNNKNSSNNNNNITTGARDRGRAAGRPQFPPALNRPVRDAARLGTLASPRRSPKAAVSASGPQDPETEAAARGASRVVTTADDEQRRPQGSACGTSRQRVLREDEAAVVDLLPALRGQVRWMAVRREVGSQG